jgi:ABC-type multidrug transport system ATPase subunit
MRSHVHAHLRQEARKHMEYAIETHGLTRRYGQIVSADDLNLAVPLGSVYGFLGPNGAVKTTTIRLLLGLIHADAGQVSLLGHPWTRAGLARVGLSRQVPHHPGPDRRQYAGAARRLAGVGRCD